ncbi:MAG: hypothetical protein ABI298_05445 [Acidimicrobiales bacterium]
MTAAIKTAIDNPQQRSRLAVPPSAIAIAIAIEHDCAEIPDATGGKFSLVIGVSGLDGEIDWANGST